MLTNFGIIVLFYCLSVASGEFGEHKCYSKYDYDEKLLLKLLKIEDKVEKFENFINELKESQELEKVKRRELFDSEMDSFRAQNAEEIERQQNLTAKILNLWNDTVRKLKDASEEQEKSQKKDVVAFTVTTPVNTGGSTSKLTFDSIITNEGNAFDKSTGKFTCPVGGLYLFTLHMTKTRSGRIDTAGCHVYLNGDSKVKAYIDPQDGSSGADAGSYGFSNSVYLRLKVGDVITVENCSGGGADALEAWSTFSGYLEK